MLENEFSRIENFVKYFFVLFESSNSFLTSIFDSIGMTYQAACGCPTQESQAIYAPPSYPPPAPASTPATHPRGTLLLSGVVRITQKGSVIYQTVPCGPPPSYDSILQLAEACNCCQAQRSIENVGGSDGNIAGDLSSAGAEGIAAPRLRRCVSNEYVQFCHVDGRQVVVGPHANTCPVCEANRRRIEQEDAYVYSPMTPPPPAGVDGAESDYGFRERPQIPKYDDGPQPMDLIYNLPVDPNAVVRPTAVLPDKPAEGGADGEEQSEECKCECVQCLADCHGNCIYGRLDLKGCKSQNAEAAAGATAALTVSAEGNQDASGESHEGEPTDESRQRQIQQLHQQLRKRHEQHVLEHQKLMQEQHKAFQEQLAKATGRKYPPSREQSEDLDSSDIPEEPEEQPLLPEPLKPTQSGDLKLDSVAWQHPLQELAECGDKEDWMTSTKTSTEKTEQTPLLQPVTEVTDPEIRQQLLQRQLLEHQWRLHQQQQQEDKGDKLKSKDGLPERESQYGIIQRRGDGCNQVFVLQPLVPSQQQQPEPIYSISLKQKQQLEQKRLQEEKHQQGHNAAWDLHKQKQLAGVQLPPLQSQPPQETQKPTKQKKSGRSFWPFSRDKSSSSEEKIPLDDRKTRNTKQRLLHQELLQHRLVFRELPQGQQIQTVQQTTQSPRLSGQLPPQLVPKILEQQKEEGAEGQSQENLLKFDTPSPRQKQKSPSEGQVQPEKQTENKQEPAAKILAQNKASKTTEPIKGFSQVQPKPLESIQQQKQQQSQQNSKGQQQQQPTQLQQTQKQEDKNPPKGQQKRDRSPQKPERGPPPKPPQRVRFSLSDTTDENRDEHKAEQSLLDMHASLQEQIPKNETPSERQDRQKKHHQKILQKQAELLEKYKREWLEKKKKEQT